MGILSGPQTDELIRLLVAAYPTRLDFEQMLWTQLSIHLDAFAVTGAGTSDYFRVIMAAEKDGWPRRLLAACRQGNPGNTDLASFTSQFDLSPAALAQEPEVIPLPKAAPAAQPTYQPPPLPENPAEIPQPGPLPPGSRLPFTRNEVFTGRKQDLKQLAAHLLYAISPTGESLDLIEALAATGMGGIGKTQLAVEFCYRYGRFTHGVHWLDANQSIQAELSACGLAMHLQPWPDELAAQVAFTLQAITTGPGPRLVVLDNLEDPALLQAWLPRLAQARILITSRREKWPRGSGVQTQEIGVMSPEEGWALLRKLADRLEQVPDPELDELGERLGWLPLALDLAGRYLADRTRLSPGDYLDELNKAGNALAQTSLSDWVEQNPTGHQTDLAASFLLSWGQLGADETLAQRIFLASGYLAPNTPIPLELLAGVALEGGETEAGFDQALKRLSELGLLKSGAEGPLIHPLLAEYARLLDAPAKKAQRSTTLESVIAAIFKLCNKPEVRNIPGNFMPLRPHLEHIIHWAEAVEDESLARLYGVFAYHLDTIADYPSAKLYYEHALAIEQKVLGKRHLATAITMNNLGHLLQMMGDLTDARAYFEKALAIYRKVLGEHHPDTATILNNLGALIQSMGDLTGARPYYEQALAIDKEALGEKDPDTATDMNNLGMLLQAMGDLEGARPYYEQALAIRREALGERHPNTAQSLNNLGLLLQDMGDLTGAQPYYENALAINRDVLGERHPQTALSLNNLGYLLQVMGDLKEARSYYEKSLAIRRDVLGERHPDTTQSLNNLGMLLRDMDDLAGARPYLEQALAINREVLGEYHPDTARSLNNLGGLLQDLGDLEGARSCLKQALSIERKVLGEHHPLTASSLNNMGMLIQTMGDLEGARHYYEQALAIDRELFGEQHPNIALSLNNMGMLLKDMGDLEGARSYLEQALAILEETLGPDHPHTRLIRGNLESLG